MNVIKVVLNKEIKNLEDNLNSILTLTKLDNNNFANIKSIKYSISEKYPQLYKCTIQTSILTCNIFYDIKLKLKYSVLIKRQNGKLQIKTYELRDEKSNSEFFNGLINELRFEK